MGCESNFSDDQGINCENELKSNDLALLSAYIDHFQENSDNWESKNDLLYEIVENIKNEATSIEPSMKMSPTENKYIIIFHGAANTEPSESKEFKVVFKPIQEGQFKHEFILALMDNPEKTFKIKTLGEAEIPRLNMTPYSIFSKSGGSESRYGPFQIEKMKVLVYPNSLVNVSECTSSQSIEQLEKGFDKNSYPKTDCDKSGRMIFHRVKIAVYLVQISRQPILQVAVNFVSLGPHPPTSARQRRRQRRDRRRTPLLPAKLPISRQKDSGVSQRRRARPDKLTSGLRDIPRLRSRATILVDVLNEPKNAFL
ncbi:unnamed protein product [Trichogramma brassicae]|uniref:Uncharacterized protein n=1 Tax=Trichogramma brassicae TaxID=86971 RepID=A0A6H5I4G3_9HYME|nr:unnamed protein product [Trichogramma brassicae]